MSSDHGSQGILRVMGDWWEERWGGINFYLNFLNKNLVLMIKVYNFAAIKQK